MMTSAIKVTLAHGVPLVRAGLQAALSAHVDIQVVQGPSSAESLDQLELFGAGVVVADFDLGLPLLRSAAASSACSVLIVTHEEREANIRRAIEAGVRGYLPMTCGLAAVVCAVRSIHAGGTAIDPSMASKMVSNLLAPRPTDRQLDVLGLLTLGLSNKAMAEKLGCSIGTIKSHVKALFAKLNATSRAHAASIARQRGLAPEFERVQNVLGRAFAPVERVPVLRRSRQTRSVAHPE